ncbi:hypothetical protein EDEG_02297 [Edhazardia aedis USNM 41457]|uniref:Uncharacterized protein n=1 Tax=Edhazardia aedis (strain USNM 41457) TaxID=1003232 RepID=J9DL93_EDHAE|nr:hypothetical protein EDEG_02297 [Edhazardia aedis USNM 41457]|eukprot:EJW03365.1 hypothetical protein EDEG_02297 [Edhazardia aedis USNM 41457]
MTKTSDKNMYDPIVVSELVASDILLRISAPETYKSFIINNNLEIPFDQNIYNELKEREVIHNLLRENKFKEAIEKLIEHPILKQYVKNGEMVGKNKYVEPLAGLVSSLQRFIFIDFVKNNEIDLAIKFVHSIEKIDDNFIESIESKDNGIKVDSMDVEVYSMLGFDNKDEIIQKILNKYPISKLHDDIDAIIYQCIKKSHKPLFDILISHNEAVKYFLKKNDEEAIKNKK